MVRRPRTVSGVLVTAMVAGLLALPTTAFALTSVEGTAIGDQGFYWETPAESWIFPHRIGNIDNRAMLQWFGASTPFNNVETIQLGPGGGVILELIDGMNLGLWFSEYTPQHGAFVGRGVTATRFNDVDSAGETGPAGLPGVDPYNAALEANRKVDLFASYWLEDMGIEAGLHLWWGSAHSSLEPDDSIGPIDIDQDSDPTTAAGDPLGVDSPDDKLPIEAGSYNLSDFGLGLGAGYAAIDGLRADLGFNVNMLGVGWSPNGVDNYVDAGGFGFGVNLRGHYDLSDKITAGGFLRFQNSSLGFEPKFQRDGGDLADIWDPPAADDQNQLPDPNSGMPTGDPASVNTGAGTGPMTGSKYEESNRHLQLAGLIKVTPNSRATLYGSVGFAWLTSKSKTSVGNDWYSQTSTRTFALPFMHIGMEGRVMSNLSMFLGATKRWNSSKVTNESVDNRIPNNGDRGGPGQLAGTPANDCANNPGFCGTEDYSNENRREIKEWTGSDTSSTNLTIGTRIHLGPLHLVGHLNPNTLLSGTWLLSGVAQNPWLWVSVIYDWDYDSDMESGSGSWTYAPHDAEPGVAAPPPAPMMESAPPAPIEEEAPPPPVEEEFES